VPSRKHKGELMMIGTSLKKEEGRRNMPIIMEVELKRIEDKGKKVYNHRRSVGERRGKN